jgi:DNA-binding NtrC family response regulator
MKERAFDFKPFDPERLRQVVGEALEVSRRMRAPAVIAEADPDPRRGRHHRRHLSILRLLP